MSKVYEVITDRIIKMLEQGTIPWKQTWSNAGGLGDHQNLVSQHQYRGINAFMTSMIAISQDYKNPYWLTYKQAMGLGGQVRKGEKGIPIVYWQFGTNKDPKTNKEEKYAWAKYSTVFNVAQIDGLDLDKILKSRILKQKRIDFSPIHECESIVNGYKNRPEIIHKDQRAYYLPTKDIINMPKADSFNSNENYYAVLFHEMTHSSGHGTRLARSGITDRTSFASHAYSKEELIAEMGAAFLCARTGIDSITLETSAAYISSWLKVLKGDPKLVISAASQAQKAVDHITGITFEYKNSNETEEEES
jgi:antirestriction protein ArdC